MPERVSFYCRSCRSRLRASAKFVGRSCPCPKCGAKIVVPTAIPSEQAPLLVMDDGHRTRYRPVQYRSLWDSQPNTLE